MQKQQFGIMDEGYFVPKSEILTWINDLLKINITKIQALGSGAIYCQIFDVIQPGKINLHKVNWKAKNDTEFLANFRLLQTAFEKSGIKRHIEVEKLVKAKYQDNLQFIQWFKRYFDTNSGNRGEGYDAVEKRNKVVPDFGFCEKTVVPKVYNGTGQTGNRDKAMTVHAKKEEGKKQQIPPRLKSPKAIQTPVTVTRKAPVVAQKKEPAKKIEKKTEPAVVPPAITKKTPVTTHNPASSSSNAISSNKKLPPHHDNHKKVEKGPTSEELSKKLKQLTDKLEMIKEIVVGENGAEMKIGLIKEVLSIKEQSKGKSPATKPQGNTVADKSSTPLSSAKKQETQEQPVAAIQEIQPTEPQLESQPQPEQTPLLSQTPASQQTEEVSQPQHTQQQDHQQEEEALISVAESHEQNHQQSSELEEKPDLSSHVEQSEHDDDTI